MSNKEKDLIIIFSLKYTDSSKASITFLLHTGNSSYLVVTRSLPSQGTTVGMEHDGQIRRRGWFQKKDER